MAWDEEVHWQLFEPLNNDDLPGFRRILAQYPENLRYEDGTDFWLQWCAGQGKLSFVTLLVDLGIGVDEAEYPGQTPLMHAAANGHLEVVRWLLDHGATLNFNVNGEVRCPALHDAAMRGHLDVVKLLVERGADLNESIGGLNAYMQAQLYGKSDVVAYLESVGMRDVEPIPDYPTGHGAIRRIITEQRGKLSTWRLELPGLTIHATRPSKKRKSQTVFTVGMSDHQFIRPTGRPFASELMVTLPHDWPLTDESMQDPVLNWPVEWLKRLAEETIAKEEWPGEFAALFPTAGSPTPFAPNTRLCAWLCLLGENTYQLPDYRWVGIRSMFPIYVEERRLVEQLGHDELLKRFHKKKLPLYVDVDRPNVAV